jgi:hypothetical protein
MKENQPRKNYAPFHELLPREGKMLDIGCGLFMSYMSILLPGENTWYDYDEENRNGK